MSDAQLELKECHAEWEVALQVLRQDKAALTAQLRKAMVSCCEPAGSATACCLGYCAVMHKQSMCAFDSEMVCWYVVSRQAATVDVNLCHLCPAGWH